jgi:para-nitrobenzyl esterase
MRAHGKRSGNTTRFSSGIVFGLAVLLAAVTFGTPVAVASPGDPVIVTESGRLQGTVGTQMIEYLGIPYAAPPEGTLRWMPPQAAAKWTGIIQAVKPGSECPQIDPTTNAYAGDENCLFLNVYTPLGTKTTKPHNRAVMVWVHGGGLTKGAGSDYNPDLLVEQGDIIVVTFNYRLGTLGFFADPGIDAEGHLNGNYGLMDQQFALQWVQNNIAAFGGDPNRVTIAGESAGGLSVYSQLASLRAAGLFQRAIAQSGAYVGFSPDYRAEIVPLTTAETTGYPPFVLSGAAVAAGVSCTSGDTTCLRAASAESFVTSLGQHAIVPIIDGTLLTETPGDAFTSGNFNQVPVITGNNHDEYRYFVATDYTQPVPDSAYSALFSMVFQGLAPSVELQYPASTLMPPPVDDTELQLSAAGTDGIFVCPTRRATKALAQHVQVWAYEFNDENAPPLVIPGLNFPLGAYHSSDVQYLFQRANPPVKFTGDQTTLSNTMISYWTHFTKTGNPNSSAAPHWEHYIPALDKRLSLIPPTPMVESSAIFDTFHMCSAYWDGL